MKKYADNEPVTFEIDGKAYRTDGRTLNVLRQIVPAAEASNDNSAVAAIMWLGLDTGHITEIVNK